MDKTLVCSIALFAATLVSAQDVAPERSLRHLLPAAPASDAADAADTKEAPALNWDAAAVDIVFQAYGEQVGKTILKDPSLPGATITLKSREGQKLTKTEYLEAIEVVLEMNGIHLEPYGEKFIRAVPRGKARKEGIPLYMDISDVPAEYKDGRVVSVMVYFKSIATDEAQKALEGLKSDTAVLNVFERTNSILVTDTWQNIKRMDEIARTIDISSPVLEQVFVYQVENASADDIKQALEQIVTESQKEQEKNGKSVQSGSGSMSANGIRVTTLGGARLLSGNRPGQPEQPKPVESTVTAMSDADRGMIRGKVLIIADSRSNKLVIITSKSNYDFFEKIIKQLDVETTPDTVVKVYRMKYADATEVADMVDDLIGNAPSSKYSSKGSQNAAARGQGGTTRVSTPTGTSSAANATRKSANQRTGDAKPGELSKENTTILADKRINGIVVMTNKNLVPVIENIIESMDIKLSQVLIETVIVEVLLKDGLSTGIDWVHGMQEKGSQYMQAIGGGGGTGKPVASGAAGSALVDGAATALPTIFAPGTAGLSYALFSERLNLSAIITASKSDSHSRYIASPIVMTVDNKKATIDATENRQFLTGWTAQSSGYSGGGQPTPNYSAKDIGLKLTITPKINPNGTVMLTVEEEYSQFMENAQSMLIPQTDSSGRINYSSGNVDLAIERKMSADILLENKQTVVLGGLTETKVEESDVGIPILKDIPLIGRWLFGKTEQSENRKELLVFLTPYVLDDADAAQLEALRRKQALSDTRPFDTNGWSASSLSDPMDDGEQLRRLKEEWEKQDADREARLAIEEEKAKRAKAIEEMDKAERDRKKPAEAKTAEEK